MPKTATVVPPEDRRTIFIATTEETIKSGWFIKALKEAAKDVDAKHPDIELEPWPSSFETGEFTALKLIEVASSALGAVIVLAGDDNVTSREHSQPAPRDNLVLEAGMFLSRLGLRNVLLLREANSKWPSDLLGVNAKEFTAPPPERAGASEITSRDIAQNIKDFVDKLPHRDKTSAGAALDKTATRMVHDAQDFNKRVESPPAEEPITIYDPREAYIDALSHVETAFATTTYLDSGFWTSRDIKIVGANKRMLNKIKRAKGTARRLIILNRSIPDELDNQRRRRRLLRSGAPDEVERMNREYRAFARTNLALIKQGFEVRIAHDMHGAHQSLPEKVFQPGDTELALYDEARVDSFFGFTSKDRSRVEVYDASKFLDFEVLQAQAGMYFAALWESKEAEDFAGFGVQMDLAIEEVNNEIDYSPNWLALYDRAGGEDGALKAAEGTLIRKWLKSRYGSINARLASHVDLGTCTGRYIAELSSWVREDARVTAIDMDPDCIRLVKLKQSRGELRAGAIIREGDIRQRDKLPTQTYDLVTCMMGTLCHLNRKTQVKSLYQDDWQTALENIARLLASAGDAFVAVWDRERCQNGGGVLDIYDDRSRSILCEKSPSQRELQARIRQAGLEVLNEDLVQNRLRVMHLSSAE